MSDFSLTLVLQIKSSKIINGMAKVQIKSERITPFGGIFHVREQFSRFVGPVIDKVLDVTLSPITFISHLNKPPDEKVTCPCVLLCPNEFMSENLGEEMVSVIAKALDDNYRRYNH